MLNKLRFSIPAELKAGVCRLDKKDKLLWDSYCLKFGEVRLVKLLTSRFNRIVIDSKPIYYTTGSHIKYAQFNKNRKTPTNHSYITYDGTNKKYKHWYCMRIRGLQKDNGITKAKGIAERVMLPLMTNEKYHKWIKYDLRKEHFISLSASGQINISLTYDRDYNMPALQATTGVDTNLKHNLLTDSDMTAIHIPKQTVAEWISVKDSYEVIKKDNGNKLEASHKYALKKHNLSKESYIKNKIGEYLRLKKNNGVTDIICEELAFYLGGESSRALNSMVRIIRMSSIRKWLRDQAHNLSMRVHDLPSAHTSRLCTICGSTHKNNRKTQEEFLCTTCATNDNADTHAAKTIKDIFENLRDVLVSYGFLKLNDFFEYVTTQKAHTQEGRDILKKLYTTYYVSTWEHFDSTKCF